MTTDNIDQAMLAPLEDLIAIYPRIQQAKERALLGEALLKATNAAEQYSWIPERLGNLSVLLNAMVDNNQKPSADLRSALNAVIGMGYILASELSIDDLVAFNQNSIPQLPLHIQNIDRQIEHLWRDCVEHALGGQAALGQVLSAIPGVESLGRDVANLAARVNSLKDPTRPALERATERDELMTKASAMANRLLEAGVAPPIAAFLVAVAANPVQLSDLTEEIFAWIRDNGALALFSISTRRS